MRKNNESLWGFRLVCVPANRQVLTVESSSPKENQVLSSEQSQVICSISHEHLDV